MAIEISDPRRVDWASDCDRAKLTIYFHKLCLGRTFDGGGACTLGERLGHPNSAKGKQLHM